MNILKTLTVALSITLATIQGVNAQEESMQSAEYHDNVVIVLDASGSMKQKMRGTRINKMDAAKTALKAVLQNVTSSTHIGLLVFSSKNLKDDWAYALGPLDKNLLLTAIESPIPNRGTPLGEYIKIGADRLLKARKAQYGYGSYRLLIVTDGDANDPNLVDKYTPQVLARGITMDVIGVDMEGDHTLATMAHSYRRANNPESLEQAIREVFAELSSDSGTFEMEEAFALIAPLPIESASAAIQALSTSGNDPIGEGSLNKKQSRARQNSQVNTSQAPRQNTGPQQTTIAVETRSSNLLKVGIVLFIILLVLAKKLF